MIKDAVLSDCEIYRYILSRVWDEQLPLVNIIGLNPSTADDKFDDPTIRRCINFAKQWGYGGFIMTNLFAFRSPKPTDLKKFDGDKIGTHNNEYIKRAIKNCDISVIAWGNHGRLMDRDLKVLKLINSTHYLEMSKLGLPKHPLYLKGNLIPMKLSKADYRSTW